MAVRSITRYENSACPITVSDRKSQIPKTDVIEFNCKLFAYGLMEECAEIEVSVFKWFETNGLVS